MMSQQGQQPWKQSTSPDPQPGELASTGQRSGEQTTRSLLSRVRTWLSSQSISYRRLDQALIIFDEEHKYLKSLRNQDSCPGDNISSWEQRSEALLEQAKAALKNHDVELGWRCFKAAAQYHLCGMAERCPSMFLARRQTIHHEAKAKLSGWRKDFVLELLDKTERPDVHWVVRAAQILDEHHDNNYNKLELLRYRLTNLTIAASVILGLWIVIAPFAMDNPLPTSPDNLLGGNSAMSWLVIACVGVMGAILSAFISTRSNFGKSRIPVYLADTTVTLTRLAIAALTAVIAVILLHSGFITLGEEMTVTLAVALAAGFSERLVVRTLERAGAEEQTPKELNLGIYEPVVREEQAVQNARASRSTVPYGRTMHRYQAARSNHRQRSRRKTC